MQIDKQKLPMQITMLRIYLTLPILVALYLDSWIWSFVAVALFLIASISDYYDGYFARKYNAVSTMGKFMDPVADKILVTSILTVLISVGKVDPYLVILLVVRDTLVAAIRSVAAADGVVIAARNSGKWKTALQMGAIPAVMLGGELPLLIDGGWLLVQIGRGVLWFSVILSLWSGWQYYQTYLSASGDKGTKHV